MLRYKVLGIVSAFAFAFVACGQSKTPEQIIEWAKTLPPGTQIDYEAGSTTEKATGTGASLEATGDKASGGIDATAPDAKLSGGVGASGGASKATGEAENIQFNWLLILTWVLAAACGGLALWQYKRGNIKPATSYAIVALALGTVAFFPAVLPIAAVAVVGYLLVQSGVLNNLADKSRADAEKAGELVQQGIQVANQYREGLRAVAAGVDQYAKERPVDGAVLKKTISAHADERDRSTIREIRREDGLA